MPIKCPLTVFRGWTEADGKTPFVFDGMPAGSRAAWACLWSTSHGLVSPVKWAAVENMTPDELGAELGDVIARTGEGRAQLEALNRGDLEPTRRFLGDRREAYPEYILPEDPPAKIHLFKYRPGWNIPNPPPQITAPAGEWQPPKRKRK